MDKGVKNNHSGHITVSGRPADPDKGIEATQDLILRPGLNRLTPEQYRQIRSVPVIKNYFEAKLLEDATPPEPEETKPEGKPLDKMNKKELTAKAAELNIDVGAEDTNATLIAKIQTALAA